MSGGKFDVQPVTTQRATKSWFIRRRFGEGTGRYKESPINCKQQHYSNNNNNFLSLHRSYRDGTQNGDIDTMMSASAMIIGNGSGNGNSLDQELSRAAEQSLTLGEHCVTKMMTEDRIRRPRQNYADLYHASLPSPKAQQQQQQQQPTTTTTTSNGMTAPVPGFPDFPDCWQGFEGGHDTVVVQRNNQKKQYGLGEQESLLRSTFQYHTSLLSRWGNHRKQTTGSLLVRNKTTAPKRIWKRRAVNRQACRHQRTTKLFRMKKKVCRDENNFINNPHRAVSVISYELTNLKIHRDDAH